MKYKNKIYYVEAIRFDGGSEEAIQFTKGAAAVRNGITYLNGHELKEGDYIIDGGHGSYWAWNEWQFKHYYEEVGE